METIINTIPGYQVHEYLLVLSPHEELWNRIMKVKEDFSKEYKSDHAKWGKPHITLVNYLQYEMKYHVVKRFEFQNLPVTTRQGELFG